MMLGKTIAKVVVGGGLLGMLLTCTGSEGKARTSRPAVRPARVDRPDHREGRIPAQGIDATIPSPRPTR